MKRAAPRPGAPAAAPAAGASWASWVVAAGAFALYAWQAPTVAGDKDSAELTLALAVQGVPHPTGYPLYVLLGHPFVRALHVAGASWALAANLWSALGGAVSMGLFHALAARLIDAPGARARALAALVPVALFGSNPVWTYEATLAEVNSWHLAWVAAAALAYVRALAALDGDGAWPRARGLRLAAGWGALCGLGGAHHATALLVAAPLSVALLVAGRRRGRAGAPEAAVVLLAALGPLASLGFVAWRAFHPAAWQWPTLEASWASVAAHLTGGGYAGHFGRFAPGPEQVELLSRYVYPALWPALAVFLLGALPDSRRWALWPLGAVTGLSLAFAFGYGVPDPSSYFLPPLALATVGAAAVLSSSAAVKRRPRAVLAGALLLSLGLGVRWGHLGLQRRELFAGFERQVRSMWEVVPDQPSFVLWPSDMSARLLLYQRLDGEKPRVEVVNPLLLPAPGPRAAFTARHGFDPLAGVPVPGGVHSGGPGAQAYAEALGARLNATSPLPVILFDPERDSVRLLRKGP